MSTNALWSKQRRDNFLAFIFIVAVFCSCDVNDQVGKPIVEHEQSCDSCNWEVTDVPFVDAIPTDTFKITGATCIPFFNVVNGTCKDSAVRKEFNKLAQFRYNLIDQFGWAEGVIDAMDEAQINVLDSLGNRSVVFFEDDQHEYIVDISKYECRDGMLLYKPGKAPIYWTMDVYGDQCNDSTFWHCYFGK